MLTIPTLRKVFLKDFKEAQKELYLNLAHINTQEAIDNILHILVALRIASIVYKERMLQKNIEEILTMIINQDRQCNQKTIQSLYRLIKQSIP